MTDKKTTTDQNHQQKKQQDEQEPGIRLGVVGEHAVGRQRAEREARKTDAQNWAKEAIKAHETGTLWLGPVGKQASRDVAREVVRQLGEKGTIDLIQKQHGGLFLPPVGKYSLVDLAEDCLRAGSSEAPQQRPPDPDAVPVIYKRVGP